MVRKGVTPTRKEELAAEYRAFDAVYLQFREYAVEAKKRGLVDAEEEMYVP